MLSRAWPYHANDKKQGHFRKGGQAQANLYVRMIFGSLQNLDWKDKRLDKAPEPQRETGYQRDRISEVTGAEER